MIASNGVLQIIPLQRVPLINKGADLVKIILACFEKQGEKLQDKDIVVVSHKIVSKAEGNTRDLRCVIPSERATALAAEVDKDRRMVQVILEESARIVRKRKGLLIMQHHRGWICANAGVDFSNVPGDCVATLPKNPDLSAWRIKERIRKLAHVKVAVVISDSQGRPFRKGVTGVAIGCAGMAALASRRGERDLYSYELKNTEVAIADQIATAGLLVIGESDEGVPAAIVRGLRLTEAEGCAQDLIRPEADDLFH